MQYTLLDAWNTLQTINSNYFRGCHGSGLLLTFHYSPFKTLYYELILKRFPQFKMFVDLHLSNHYGAPMYPVENGFYHITNSSKETAINYLRITETEYNLLYQAEDKQYFKYLLYTLGIVERWKRESNEALKKLEELTGQTWENPYKPENERFTLKLTDEEKRKAYEKKRAEIINNCEKKQEKAENEKRVMLAVLDAGLSVSNVTSEPNIYYNAK